MNYISEINAFYVWLVANPISGNAQALWHRLMAYCNAFGWKERFTVTNTRLVDDLSISRQELDRVRNALCQKGLIDYTKGHGGKCGTYRMLSLSHNVTSRMSSDITSDITSDVTSDVTGCGHLTLPLDKLNKTKPNKNYLCGTSPPTNKKFVKPTLDEVAAYCRERDNTIDPERFISHYEAVGWRVGKNPMKDWRAAIRTWEGNQKRTPQPRYDYRRGGDRDGDSL